MILTRLLYIASDVKYNITYCILHQHKDELEYWLAEYFMSGFCNETLQLLIKIYYTYYAAKYPSLEKYIIDKAQQQQSTLKYNSLSTIAHTLRTKTPSYILEDNSITRMRGRKPYIKTLLQKKKWKHIIRFMFSIPDEELIQYYISICLYYDKSVDINGILEYYHTIVPYLSLENQRWMIIALTYHLSLQDDDIHRTHSITLLQKKFQDKYVTLNKDIPRKILVNHIKYASRKVISKDIHHKILEQWVNYLYSCPLWQHRIHSHNGKMVKDKLTFNNDDHLENFYDNYGYEVDEQGLTIQQMIYPYV